MILLVEGVLFLPFYVPIDAMYMMEMKIIWIKCYRFINSYSEQMSQFLKYAMNSQDLQLQLLPYHWKDPFFAISTENFIASFKTKLKMFS